jgi:hypothetical protein
MSNPSTQRAHSNRDKGLLLAFLVASVGAGIVATACSSGSGGNSGTDNADSSTSGSSSGGSGSGSGGGDGGAGACANPTLNVVFAPMYSAYIPGSTAQVFQIPAVTDDGNTATWSLSDPTQATLAPQSFTSGGTTLNGVMITIKGTGDSNGNVTVFATEGSACGSSVLHITQNTESDWVIGNGRYNDGVAIHLPSFDGGGPRPDGGFGGFGDGGHGGGGGGGFTTDAGSFLEEEGGTACTNCHGPTATNGLFNDVSHTPEQTGGFSDEDLQNIILNGQIPDGGYFDPTVIIPTCDGGAQCTQRAYEQWSHLHQWTDITPDELPGIICYLRSLTPAPQNGTSNFGGGGGGHHHDGGFGPPPTGDQ